MLATQLHEIVRDFAVLPGSRLALLEALPGYVEKHFGATGIVSVLHDGQLRVLASSDPRYRPGCEPPEAAELSASTSAGDSFERYRPDCPEHPYMVAWPLHERAGIIAVLQLLRRVPLQEVSQVTLEIFTQLISSKLTDTSRSRQAAAVAELVTALYTSSSLEDAAQLALDLICGFMDAEAGYLLQARAGSMTPLANSGFAAADERALRIGIGQPYPEGLAWQACIGGQPLWLPVAGSESGPLSLPVVTVVQPIGWRDHYRYVLVLRLRPRAFRSSADAEAFNALCVQLHLGLDRLHSDFVQDELLNLQSHGLDASSDTYKRIIDLAVKLVPGAHAGSLLVRRNNLEPFTFQAVHGYDLADLKGISFNEEDMQRWYGRDRDSWESGHVRELRASETDILEASSATVDLSGEPVPGTALIRATVCLPVSFRGDVLGFLNLDSFHDENAFGDDSARVLRQFSPVMASVLGALREREQIVEVAHTDALTGLPNRRGFDVALEAQIRLAERNQTTLALLVLDLKHFKDVNDSDGHEAGDQALCQVAELLKRSAREDDLVSRWGGDEFAVLLPGADSEIAAQVADRISGAINRLRFREVQLAVHVGAAHFPEDATSGAELMQIADSRMYATKLKGRRSRRSR